MNVNNDVIENSYYMINLFHQDSKIITNLQLQKLMYFTECFYMVITNENSLYDDECVAWTYGPVYRNLYNRFKEFSKGDIIISDEQIAIGERVPQINKKVMKAIYSKFGDFTSTDLVGLTHMEDSPWDKANKIKESIDIINMNIPISKIESSVWFKKKFMKYSGE